MPTNMPSARVSTGKIFKKYPSPLTFRPFCRLNLYRCNGQTILPAASTYPSTIGALAWGHFWAHPCSLLSFKETQMVLPAARTSASPLELKLISSSVSAILCQVYSFKLSVYSLELSLVFVMLRNEAPNF